MDKHLILPQDIDLAKEYGQAWQTTYMNTKDCVTPSILWEQNLSTLSLNCKYKTIKYMQFASCVDAQTVAMHCEGSSRHSFL